MQHKAIQHKIMQQGTQEWFEIRCGKITGSIAKKFIKQTELTVKSVRKTTEIAQSVYDEVFKLIGQERVVYDENDILEFPRIPSYAQERGYAGEQDAINFYEEQNLVNVEKCGFIESECNNFGFSPDGLVKDGFIEIKTINAGKHLKVKRDGIMNFLIDEEYYTQILMGFFVEKKFKFCDYIIHTASFKNIDERFSIFRIERNEEDIEKFANSLYQIIKIKNDIKKQINL
jgi:hypothetical protein